MNMQPRSDTLREHESRLFPRLGFGVGLRAEHYDDVLSGPRRIVWFEAISENYIDSGGRPLHVLERVRHDYSVALHGVALSIGSADPLSAQYLRNLRTLVQRAFAVAPGERPRWLYVGLLATKMVAGLAVMAGLLIVKLGVKWEEYERPRRQPLIPPRPKHPIAAKREKARQKTLAKRRAQEQRQNPPDPSDVLERTLIAKVPELTSWSDCPVPLAGVYSKDCYADGHEKDWLLVTTNPHATASGVRDDYALRTDIEELHRQVKCFWDLTRFPSTAWNVIVSQTVFVALTYSLLQLHLLKHGHQELNRFCQQTQSCYQPFASAGRGTGSTDDNQRIGKQEQHLQALQSHRQVLLPTGQL